jgi:hypothetical protein
MDPNLPQQPVQVPATPQPIAPVSEPLVPAEPIVQPSPLPQIVAQPVSDTPPEQNKSKAPILLFLFFIILAFGMGGFYLYQKYQSSRAIPTVTPMPTIPPNVAPSITPTPDPMAGWKTYSNTIYKYSFKYPTTWKTQAIGAGPGAKEAKADTIGLDVSDPTIKRTYPYGVLTVQIATRATDSNYTKWTKSEITLGTIKATKYESLTKKDLKSIAITLKTPGNKFLEILFRDNPDSINWTTFSQILSSITFLDGLDPTGWKLYKSDKYYYQVNYPTDLKLTSTTSDLVSFSATDINFEIGVGSEEIPEMNALDEYFYLDNPITRTTTVGGIKANVYELTDQIVFVTLFSKHYYTIIFKGDTKMSEAELLILSTFKFLTPSPSPSPSPIR